MSHTVRLFYPTDVYWEPTGCLGRSFSELALHTISESFYTPVLLYTAMFLSHQ